MKKSKKKSLLVWIDLEMTGLDTEKDVILEIASIITDNNLTVIANGPAYIIHQPETHLDTMNDWCKKHHTESGLVDAVRASIITLEDARQKTLQFIQAHCEPQTALLCGNSIWQDRLFLAKYMPDIVNFLSYRMIDVSSIKEVIKRWHSHDKDASFKKSDSHRAHSDILESIEELKHYRKYFFV